MDVETRRLVLASLVHQRTFTQQLRRPDCLAVIGRQSAAEWSELTVEAAPPAFVLLY